MCEAPLVASPRRATTNRRGRELTRSGRVRRTYRTTERTDGIIVTMSVSRPDAYRVPGSVLHDVVVRVGG